MDGREELLKERLLQLEEISQRRKVLLGELYHVLKGSVYGGLEDTIEDGLSSFLAQFDFESDKHHGSIENLDEWLQNLPAPFDEEPEEPEEEPEEEPVEEEIQETREVSQEPEVLEILEEDAEEPSPPTVPIVEDIQPEPIQILPEVDDSEYHTATPPQEPEVHEELSPTSLAPAEIAPPSPIPVAPTPVVEEARSPSPEFVSQSPPSIPLDLSPAPMTPDFEEEPDATVDIVTVSDEEEIQSFDSHIENVPRTPPTTITIPSTIDTALLYRGPDQPIIVAPPSPVHDPQYNFDPEFSFDPVKLQENKELPYSLPLLGSLPPEFRKKTTRAQRKREKERERTDLKKEEDWSPMGMARWRALLRANPTWQYLSRSTKSLTTRDWNVALTELRLIRTFDRIDMLKDSGRWSFRQPKKQRGLGGLVKTHWDYLMDEMKWMRIDFREERKWKIAVAYSLALAVQEWHEAGSTEERIQRGICVVWSKSLEEGIPDSSNAEDSNAMSIDLPRQRLRSDSMLVVEESDDCSDEEEKDAAILADVDVSMAESEEVVKSELTQEPENMKVEDNFDFTSALQAAPTTESQDQAATGANSSLQDSREGSDPTPPGMRVTSENPMMSFANNGLSAATQGAMRERVAFMDLNKVFLDADDLGLTNLIPKPSTEEAPDYVPPTIDLVALFGDVQAYGLPEPIPAVVQLDLNKKNRREREDVCRRLDEANTTKLVPVSQFMFCRPTLVSALQPSRHWKDGTWTGLDESPVCPTDTPPFSQEFACSLFERNGYNNYNNLTFRAPSADPKRVQESRMADQLWTPQDDQLLKDLFGTYGNNWHLIADCFNSLRHVVSTDIRTNWDCYHRFAALNARQQEPDTPSSSQVTTRTKRQFSLGLDTSGSNADNRKRRRHYVVLEAFRRLAKKKDSAAKVLAVQTKRQTGLHETHHQINNMPKLTPQELSRKKEYSDLVLRRQAEEARNRQLREQQARLQGTAGTAAVNRSALQFPNGVGQTIPQLRGQVNISQQQRLAAALQHQLSQSGARISPQQQQLMQAQVRMLEAQQQAQGQGQQTQTPTPQQPQSGQTQPQQPAIQIQTHNLSTQPVAQPLVTMMRFADGSSASPPPQQATPSNSGTPVSVNGNSNGNANGNAAAATQRPASGQNQEAISSPLDPDTAAVITSIGARPVASYYNAIQALQSMFEANDGVTVSSNPGGSTQTRFQATPQPPQQQQTQISPPQNGVPAATYPTQS